MRLTERYEAFLLDLDGVVYRGDTVLPAARETVAALRSDARRVVFLTNNSAWTPDQVCARLARMGIPASPDDVVSAAQATGVAIARHAGDTRRPRSAFLIGEEGLRRGLSDAGIEVVEDGDAGYVVVGWDRSLTYEKLRRASVLVRSGAQLVAANADATFPASDGELWPGAGALLAAVETASGRRARVIGKPQRELFDVALERMGTRDALVVGDRIETDIAGARAAGLDAALVLTGVSTAADLLDHDEFPVAVSRDLRGLLDEREPVRVSPARPEHLEAVVNIVDPASSWVDAIDSGLDATVVATGDDGSVIATASADVRGEDAYLRGVGTLEGARSVGIGTLVVAAAARRAAGDGARRMYLLTEGAAPFFQRLGFARVARDDVPAWALARSPDCPDTAIAMLRALPDPP